MGEASTDSDLFQRIRAWTKKGTAPGRSPDSEAGSDTLNAVHTEKADPHNGPQIGSTTYHGNEKDTGSQTSDSHDKPAHPVNPVNNTSEHGRSRIETEEEGASNTSVTTKKKKPPIPQRLKAGTKRFGKHTYGALTHSWMNILLLFVPVGIAVEVTGQSPSLVFAVNAVAVIPLAGLLVYATESVASRLGDTLGALLNVSFGNAVELILYIIALTKGQIRIVQASLIGSILGNLLLILGMAFLFGGLRFQEQIYNNTITQMSACLLSLSVISLILPTAFHASFSDSSLADLNTLKISRATSIILLVIYVLYLLFQLKSHAYLYESTPQHIIDEESHPGILADIMDTSSSSDSSDSSSSDGSDTSGSHTTTKRIKRAFRHRRRRKSSTSSTNTPSLPSIISSPSFEKPANITEPSLLTFSPSSRRPSALTGIMSGDEADVEPTGRRGDGQPRVRDFVANLQEEVAKEKNRKKAKKHKKKFRKHHLEGRVPEESMPTKAEGKKPSNGSSNGPAARAALRSSSNEKMESVTTPEEPAPKRGLAFRPFQAQTAQTLRPALPKMLTQNVFVTAPQSSTAPASKPTTKPVATVPSAPVRTGAHVLRRTNSLPDRLNQSAPPVTRQLSVYPHAHPIAHTKDKSDDDDEDDEPPLSRTASAVLLLITTALVAVCAEFLVGAIPGMLESSPVSQEFVGLIILPVVSNAAEHFTAVIVASKNKMDLAIGVSVGSSIQIALFVTPIIVLLGWIIDQNMTLFFNLFETVCIFVTAFVVNFLVLDGRSNYLEGSLLMAAYTIIAVGAYFYPNSEQQSNVVGGS